MKGGGLFNLVILFGFISYLVKHVQARSNVLHEGVLDSLSYDPSLLSMLQMEQSLDLDDDQAAYFGTSLLDRSPNFLQQNSGSVKPAFRPRAASFLEDDDEDGSFLDESLYDDDDDLSTGESFAEDSSERSRSDSSFLESGAEAEDVDDDDDGVDAEDDTDLGPADGGLETFLEMGSSSSCPKSKVPDTTDDDAVNGGSFLQTDFAFKRPLSSPNTFGSLIQMHSFEPDPTNFLQDDTLVLVNDDDQADYDLEEPPKKGVKAFVLKSDAVGDDVEPLDTLDETFGDRVLAVMQAYKVWLVVISVLLLIAVLVRLFYLERFMKFKAELLKKVEDLNKTVTEKWNALVKKNQQGAENEQTPLLSA